MTYPNGKTFKLDDYVRVEREGSKNFWGWVKGFPSEDSLEIIDKKGKLRQVLYTECVKATSTKLTRIKGDLMSGALEKISYAVRKTKRHK